jgi:hypothetical protein
MNCKKTLLIISGFLFAQSCLGMEEGRTIFYVGKDNKAREHDINAQGLYHMRIPTDRPKMKPAEQPKKLTQVQNTQPQIVQVRVINQPNPAASRPQTTQEMVRINPDINQLQNAYQRDAIIFENMHKKRMQLLDEYKEKVTQNNIHAADNLENQIYDINEDIKIQSAKLNRLSAQINMHTRNQALVDQVKKQQEIIRASSKSATVTSESETLPVTIMTMASDSKPQEAILFGPSLAHHEPTLEFPGFMIAHPHEGDEYKISAPEFRHNQQQNLEEVLEKITTQDAAEFKEQTA